LSQSLRNVLAIHILYGCWKARARLGISRPERSRAATN